MDALRVIYQAFPEIFWLMGVLTVALTALFLAALFPKE